MAYSYVTGFKQSDGTDIGLKYITKEYMMDTYPALTSDINATIWGWGHNNTGALGLPNTTTYSVPVQTSGNGWRTVATGQAHTVFVKNDNTLWACGYNADGECGTGGTGWPVYLQQIGALSNWRQIAAGGSFSIATKTDGTLWSWGYNNAGQLGLGDTVTRSSPVQVGSLTNWKSVAAAGKVFVALKYDGTAWSCGYGSNGATGQNNTSVSFSSPVQIGLLTNWKQIAGAGIGRHFAAVKTDGTLWTWGYDSYGQCGCSSIAAYGARKSPTQVGGLTTWKKVFVWGNSTAAIKTDGTCWIWGGNSAGQLGLGDTIHRSSPVQLGSLTNWKSFNGGSASAAHNFTLAVKTDGTLWSWGYDGYGVLGLGDTVARSSPVQVGSATNWKIIAGGEAFSVGLKEFTDF